MQASGDNDTDGPWAGPGVYFLSVQAVYRGSQLGPAAGRDPVPLHGLARGRRAAHADAPRRVRTATPTATAATPARVRAATAAATAAVAAGVGVGGLLIGVVAGIAPGVALSGAGAVRPPRRPYTGGGWQIADTHQGGRDHRHEGGGARARRGAAAGALGAPEGGQGGRRRRAGRPAARAQAPPGGRGGLPGRGPRRTWRPARRSRRRRSRPICPRSSPTRSWTRWCGAGVAETGASSPRDMGQVIKHVMGAAGGRADGKRVSTKVKEALN